MPLWYRIARIWIPVALAITAAVGFTYLATQQSYRNGLDDPQVQLALDASRRLTAGDSPQSVIPTAVTDVDASLAPFVIVYSSDNTPLAWSGTLNGNAPVPPTGVLDAARASTPNKVTWQPAAAVRIASVSAAAADGRVVLAGRNMRLVEARIDDLGKLALLAWAAAVLGALAVVAALEAYARHWDAAVARGEDSLP
jgi:hypothetical protein